jgi:hypothetical protein
VGRAVARLTNHPPCQCCPCWCTSMQRATRSDLSFGHESDHRPALVQVPLITIHGAVVVAVSTGAAAHAIYTMWTASNWTLRRDPWAVLPISLAVYICVPVCLLLLSLILPQHRVDVLINNRFVGVAALAMVGTALLSIPAGHILAM